MHFFKFETSPQKSLMAILVASFLIKVIFVLCTPLNLSPDESYYWDWSRHLDWSYYSKGPISPLLIRLGCFLFGESEFGVRFPSLLLGSLFLVGLYRTLLLIGSVTVASLTTILFATSPFFFALGIGATTDPPCLAFLIWGVYFAMRAEREERGMLYALAGFLLGVATLAKLTCAVVLGVWGIWVLFKSKSATSKVLVLVASVLPLVPLVWWNYNHDWINILHNTGHLTKTGSSAPLFLNTLTLLFGQLGCFGPIQCVVVYFVIAQGSFSIRTNPWLISALILTAICLCVSIGRPVYANWPIPLYPLLVAGLLSQYKETQDAVFVRLLARYARHSVILLAAVLLVISPVILGVPLGKVAGKLPLKKLVGWRELARDVDSKLRAGEFVYVSRYDIGSSVAFYSSHHPEIVCGAVKPRRMNQYDLWSTWSAVKGQNAVVILEEKDQANILAGQFESVEYLGLHEVIYQGNIIKTLHLFRGLKFNGEKPRIDRDV